MRGFAGLAGLVPASWAQAGGARAYTHVGLIHAAITISELLEARDGKVRAWTRGADASQPSA